MPTARKLITLDQAIEAAKKVIVGKENFVYQQRDDIICGCSYSTSDGAPSCVVGWMVKALRPKAFKELVRIEANRNDSFSASGLVFGSVYSLDVQIFEPDAEEFLTELQDAQDSGRTWGYALQAALQLVGRD